MQRSCRVGLCLFFDGLVGLLCVFGALGEGLDAPAQLERLGRVGPKHRGRLAKQLVALLGGQLFEAPGALLDRLLVLATLGVLGPLGRTLVANVGGEVVGEALGGQLVD